MYSQKELKEFFDEYLPKTRTEIERLWVDNRGELNEFMQEWVNMTFETWMSPYMQDMQYLAKNGSHKFPDPWEFM